MRLAMGFLALVACSAKSTPVQKLPDKIPLKPGEMLSTGAAEAENPVTWNLPTGERIVLAVVASHVEKEEDTLRGVLRAIAFGKSHDVTRWSLDQTTTHGAEVVMLPDGRVLFVTHGGGSRTVVRLEWKPNAMRVWAAETWQGSDADEPPAWAALPKKDSPPAGEVLARALVAKDAVGYHAREARVAYVQCWQAEGVGEGCEVVFAGLGGKEVSRRALVEPGEGEEVDEPEREQAIRDLAPQLAGFTALAKHAWPEVAKDLRVDALATVFHWDGRRVSWDAALPRGATAGTRSISVEKGYEVTPEALYAAKGKPVVVVSLWHDPGEKYGEGLNLVQTYEVIRIRP